MPPQPAKAQDNASQTLIFLDLDGVLADFWTHAVQENKVKDGTLDRTALNYEWWATVPVFAGAKAFYDAACRMAPVKFLTAAVIESGEGCYAGKAHWVQAFVPERGKSILNDLIMCRPEDKCYLAKPNRILVDDREDNIKTWRAAGGIGILHTGDFKDTMKQLQGAMTKLAAASTPLPAKKHVGRAHLPKFR